MRRSHMPSVIARSGVDPGAPALPYKASSTVSDVFKDPSKRRHVPEQRDVPEQELRDTKRSRVATRSLGEDAGVGGRPEQQQLRLNVTSLGSSFPARAAASLPDDKFVRRAELDFSMAQLPAAMEEEAEEVARADAPLGPPPPQPARSSGWDALVRASDAWLVGAETRWGEQRLDVRESAAASLDAASGRHPEADYSSRMRCLAELLRGVALNYDPPVPVKAAQPAVLPPPVVLTRAQLEEQLQQAPLVSQRRLRREPAAAQAHLRTEEDVVGSWRMHHRLAPTQPQDVDFVFKGEGGQRCLQGTFLAFMVEGRWVGRRQFVINKGGFVSQRASSSHPMRDGTLIPHGNFTWRAGAG